VWAPCGERNGVLPARCKNYARGENLFRPGLAAIGAGLMQSRQVKECEGAKASVATRDSPPLLTPHEGRDTEARSRCAK
jgi:hypothetical protein